MNTKIQLIYLFVCFIAVPLIMAYGLAWPLRKTRQLNRFLAQVIMKFPRLLWMKMKHSNSQFIDDHWCAIIIAQISVEIIVLFLIIYPTT